jgi:F0F1-type ATP synthase assembly protein I
MPNELDEKIYRFEKKLEDEKKKPLASGMEGAGRAGYEIMVAMAFFTIVGVLLDWQLETMPWCTLVLFFVGFITGVYNAWRTMNAKGDRVGLTTSAKIPEPKDKV